MASDERRWERLLSWLKTQHGMNVKDGLLVTYQEVEGAGRGLFARQTCPPSTILFTVPAHAMINVNTLAPVLPARARELSAIQQISLYLMLHRPHGEDDSPDPAFGPYISTLPRDFASHPVSWMVKQAFSIQTQDEGRMLELLPPSVILALRQRADLLRSDWEAVKKCLEGTGRYKELLHSRTYDNILDDFLWAWLNVNTRCIYYRIRSSQSDLDNLTMCPVLDFANHSQKSHIFPVQDAEIWGPNKVKTLRDDFKFVSCAECSVEADQELFLRYGGHPNATLFVDYGFVKRFSLGAVESGDHPGEIHILDLMEELFTKSRHAAELKRTLEDAGYWGDWTLHSSPRPAYPSYRVIAALRLYHVLDGAPNLLEENAVVESWLNTIAGLTLSISNENEAMWRKTLLDMCENILTRAQHMLETLADVPGGRDTWSLDNIRLLWQEEMEVAAAVSKSIQAGEEF